MRLLRLHSERVLLHYYCSTRKHDHANKRYDRPSSIPASYSGGLIFRSRPAYSLFGLKLFVVLLRTPRQLRGKCHTPRWFSSTYFSIRPSIILHEVIGFSIQLILPVTLWPWARLRLLTEINVRNLSGRVGGGGAGAQGWQPHRKLLCRHSRKYYTASTSHNSIALQRHITVLG
jgi:hypothetical protein